MNSETVAQLDWKKVDNLMPVVIQNAISGDVLMLGYMNKEALNVTLESGNVTFYSRTKQRLWAKGETSGNFLKLVNIYPDCDNDTLLILANPIGPTCHNGTESCLRLHKASGDSSTSLKIYYVNVKMPHQIALILPAFMPVVQNE